MPSTGVRPPVVRGQSPERAPAPLKMPAPEELGIQLGAKEPPLDWDRLRQDLNRLGVSAFQLEKQGDGFRFTCRAPGGAVDCTGCTEAEAVRIGLAKIAPSTAR